MTLKQKDKASELLFVLTYALESGMTVGKDSLNCNEGEINPTWIKSAKTLAREIDNELKEITKR